MSSPGGVSALEACLRTHACLVAPEYLCAYALGGLADARADAFHPPPDLRRPLLAGAFLRPLRGKSVALHVSAYGAACHLHTELCPDKVADCPGVPQGEGELVLHGGLVHQHRHQFPLLRRSKGPALSLAPSVSPLVTDAVAIALVCLDPPRGCAPADIQRAGAFRHIACFLVQTEKLFLDLVAFLYAEPLKVLLLDSLAHCNLL